MSATLNVESQAVTPAQVRRRGREQQLRGPVARPQQLAGPGGRPLQPGAPSGLGAQLDLHVLAMPRQGAAPAAGVQLTDRGIMAIVVLLAAIVVATVGIGLVKFFGVSNAPLDDPRPTSDVVVTAVNA